jgi:hypothetical protein
MTANLTDYVDDVAALRSALVSRIKETTETRIQASSFGIKYNSIATNVMHFLGVDFEVAHEMSCKIIAESMISSDLDNTAKYAAQLCDEADVIDSADVLGAVRLGHQFMFLGFHTGPYATMWHRLLRDGANITAIVGPRTFNFQSSIDEAAVACGGGSGGSGHAVSVTDPKLLLRLRQAIAAGHQIIVYLDGYGGFKAQTSKRDVLLPFLACELTLKTTLCRLASHLGVPVVPFNAVRLRGAGRRLFVEAPISIDEETDHPELLRRIYQKLAARLVVEPFQWEGWEYGHIYLAPSYLQARRQEATRKCGRRDFFLTKNPTGEILATDRHSYRSFVVSQAFMSGKEGALG